MRPRRRRLVLLDWLRTVALALQLDGRQLHRYRGGRGRWAARRQGAATHWLAGDLLAEYGSQPSDERIVEIGRMITCEGRITAMHVALLVTLRVAGPDAVAIVRDRLAERGRTAPRTTRRWRRLVEAKS